MKATRPEDGLFIAVVEKSALFFDQAVSTPDAPASIERIASAADSARYPAARGSGPRCGRRTSLSRQGSPSPTSTRPCASSNEAASPTMSPRKILRFAAPLAVALAAAAGLQADPLSKKADIDFYTDVLSRDLHGLASRSDGRLVAGPVLTDLKGESPSELPLVPRHQRARQMDRGRGPGRPRDGGLGEHDSRNLHVARRRPPRRRPGLRGQGARGWLDPRRHLAERRPLPSLRAQRSSRARTSPPTPDLRHRPSSTAAAPPSSPPGNPGRIPTASTSPASRRPVCPPRRAPTPRPSRSEACRFSVR